MKTLRNAMLFIIVLAVLTVTNIMIMRGNHDWMITTYDETDIDKMSVSCNPEGVVEVTGIRYEDNTAYVSLKPIKKGETELTIHLPGSEIDGFSNMFSVDSLLIIKEENFAGAIDNMGFVRVEVCIMFILLLVYSLFKTRKIQRENMYSYSAMFYLGVALFASGNIIVWVLQIINSGNEQASRLYAIYGDILAVFSRFSLLAFPLMFALAIFLVISNVVLIRKEGRSLTNTLGILLGIFLVGMTVAGMEIYPILEKVMDVHSYKGYHISLFIECIIYNVLTYFECMMIATTICSIKVQNYTPHFDKDYIIILGCSIRKDGTPTPLLAGRADKAIWFANEQKNNSDKDIVFVASGGQGSDEVISEAESIRNYLVSKGIPEDKIIMEDNSTSTNENMRFSKDKINERDADAKVAFSTTGYHVFRSGNIAYREGIIAEGVGSKTKWYFYVNALIREFIANLNAARKKHILNIIAMILVIGVLLIYSYRFNIM